MKLTVFDCIHSPLCIVSQEKLINQIEHVVYKQEGEQITPNELVNAAAPSAK